MELIRAHMNIYKVRMGDRLRDRIEVPKRGQSLGSWKAGRNW